MHSVKTARAYHLRVNQSYREKITLHFSDLGQSDFGSFRVFFFFFRINLFDLLLICSFINWQMNWVTWNHKIQATIASHINQNEKNEKYSDSNTQRAVELTLLM